MVTALLEDNDTHVASSPSSLSNERARFLQGLSDLHQSLGSEVVLVRCESKNKENELRRELLHAAARAGFVTAHVSLQDCTFDSLESVMRQVLGSLKAPHAERHEVGLLSTLDRFYRRFYTRSVEHLDEGIEQFGASGDLVALARAYLAADLEAKRELREYDAWLEGVELTRVYKRPVARESLTPKTARQALGDLSRLMRALGYAGCVLLFTGGHHLTQRTPRQREKGYTVLRELIDNFDSERGAISTRITISGLPPLFEGPNSLNTLEALRSRVQPLGLAEPPPPHRSQVTLSADAREIRPRLPDDLPPNRHRAARALLRICQGLPPTEAVDTMSVGYERIDALIQQLFGHMSMAGSVFTVLTGEYGSGKTHLLLHMMERALADKHPVFRLNVERLNLDLGNPQRHLTRLLEQSVLPMRHRPSALDRLGQWTRTPAKLNKLWAAMEEIAGQDVEASSAAQKALRQCRRARHPEAALERFLGARDLEKKPSSAAYRHDAYARFLLWLALLERLDDCRGPVMLIDEAENLYTTGASPAERRTALRSLSFYCGGALPGACVVLAITPKVLKQLKKESTELLADVADQAGVLPWEDATMLKRRLSRLQPQPVPDFRRKDRTALADKLRHTHALVRGRVDDDGWEQAVRRYARQQATPREMARGLVDRLEYAFWKQKLMPNE